MEQARRVSMKGGRDSAGADTSSSHRYVPRSKVEQDRVRERMKNFRRIIENKEASSKEVEVARVALEALKAGLERDQAAEQSIGDMGLRGPPAAASRKDPVEQRREVQHLGKEPLVVDKRAKGPGLVLDDGGRRGDRVIAKKEEEEEMLKEKERRELGRRNEIARKDKRDQ